MSIFEGEAKGELLVLRDQLDGNDPRKRKQAAKRTVALMRQGENVQSLFASMLRCVKTQDIELKRLTYLYLVQYSTHEPEQAIMAVNTFISDSQDPSPLIRGLAVRTMCRIKLENVAEHMLSPLKKSLSDPDPYVRKTAAFGVAKLYDFVPEAVENAGLFQDLLKLLKDENPMVVSNSTAAILEINEHRTSPIFTLNSDTIGPILSAITSCSEWCQTILLDALSKYKPVSHDDATFLIDRLIPFLKHSNPSVVIGAFKCIFLFMESDSRNPTELFPQIIPPFITLVTSTEPEIQYVVLRTLSLFVLKYPKSLSREIRVFFCKYNDPSYVKMEKLDIIVTICGQQTAQLVLDELKEYCNSVDVTFVQKAVRCIGQIALKIESSRKRCVDILVELVNGKADYALEESIVVMTDILRKYPGDFESVIGKICMALENVKAPAAKAAGIWILGEYCHLIDKVDMLMDPFLDTFHDEEALVQLQILASLVKIYLDKPEETKDQLQFILTEATKDGNVPDVKNRALVYWRLLSNEGKYAKQIINFSKETTLHSGVRFDDNILSELIRNMGSVSGVLHVVPSDFVRRVRFVPDEDSNDNDEERDWHQLRIWTNGPTGPQECTFLDLFSDYDRNNMYLRLLNKTETPITNLQIAINNNALGLALSSPPQLPQEIEYGATEVKLPIVYDQSKADISKTQLQIAVNTSMGVIYSSDYLPSNCVTLSDGDLGQDGFRALYAQEQQDTFQIEDASVESKENLQARNVFVIGRNQNKTYVSLKFAQGAAAIELTQEKSGITGIVKASDPTVYTLIKAGARSLFAQH